MENRKVLTNELTEFKQKLFSDSYGYCDDSDESYNHAMLNVNKQALEESLKKTSVANIPFEKTELRSKVWLMEDGTFSVDRERFTSLSSKNQNLLALFLQALQQGSKPKPANLASQRTYPSRRYTVPEAFDFVANISEGKEQSTGCVMKMVRGADNAWTIDNREDLHGRGFTDGILDRLVKTSSELQHSNKKKMKLDIINKPLVFSLSINWPSNRKVEEADDFFADGLQIPSYSLSKHDGLMNALNAVGTILDTLSTQ